MFTVTDKRFNKTVLSNSLVERELTEEELNFLSVSYVCPILTPVEEIVADEEGYVSIEVSTVVGKLKIKSNNEKVISKMKTDKGEVRSISLKAVVLDKEEGEKKGRQSSSVFFDINSMR